MSIDATCQPYLPRHSLSRAVFFSLLFHINLFLILVLCDYVPAWNSKPRVLSFGPGKPNITISMDPPADKPKGDPNRKLNPTNVSPPIPKPKPLPTPITKPKPDVKTVIKPIPTPKTKKSTTLPPPKSKVKVLKVPTKKILATPTPEPPPELPDESEEPKKIIADSDVPNKNKPDRLDDLPPIDTNTKYNGPIVEAHGVKDGGEVGGVPSLETAEGIVLPSDYLVDTWRRIKKNAEYPKTISLPPQRVVCVVQFRVALDGTISDISVRQSCGDLILDDLAKRAIEKTASLLPLKDLIKENIGKDYVTASVPFGFGGQAK